MTKGHEDEIFTEQCSTVETGEKSSCQQPVLEVIVQAESAENFKLPPDGGYGWVCCFCVTMIMFSTWGANSGFGVFLAYYFNNGVFPGATKFDYALIAGLTVGLGQGLSPFAMFATKIFGCKPPMYAGIAMLFCGFMLASFATKLWQLYLTQGVLVGFSIALLYAPSTTVIPGWFTQRRSLAVGMSLVGTGAGGITYSLSVSEIIQKHGHHAWALRMMAISCTATCVLATLLLKPFNAPDAVGVKSWLAASKEFKKIFCLRVAKIYSVDLVSLWFVFALFGYNLMIFTLSPYAVAMGLTPHQASLLTTSMNAAQTFGRPVMGYLGDKFGRVNTTVVLTAVLTIFVFAFWLTCHTFIQLLMFSICMGSCVGVGNVMSTVLVADLVQPADFLAAWSLVNALGSPFLLNCEIIAQALTNPRNANNPYLHSQIFAGVCFLCALILMLIFRELRVRKKLHKSLSTDPNYQNHQNHGNVIKDSQSEAKLLKPDPKNYFLRMLHATKI